MGRPRGSRTRKGRGRGRGGRIGRPPKAITVEAESSSEGEEDKTDDEESSEEIMEIVKPKETPPQSPPPPPKEVNFPKTLGKRKAISFGFKPPNTKRKISLVEHCPFPAASLEQRVPIDLTEDENESSEHDETDETYAQLGRKAFALDIANWLEKALQEQHLQDKINFPTNKSKAHLSLDERIRYECVNGSSLFPAQEMGDIKPSLTIKLYQKGFALGDQDTLHPYDINTEPFLIAIDHHRMPPDLLDLLEEIPCYYYDGCLIVSLIDFRYSLNDPPTRLIILRPDAESIIYDLEQCLEDSSDYKEEDIIQAEKMALQAKGIPVCLDPSPRVAIINNITNYNRLKFRLFNDKLKKEEDPSAMMPGIYYNSLNHMANKLEKSNTPRAPHIKQKETHSLLGLVNKCGPPIVDLDGEVLGMNTSKESIEVSVPTLPTDSLPYDSSSSVILRKTELKFTRPVDTKYLNFEVDKAEGMGYSAILRLGNETDPSSNAITRFLLRDAVSATKFTNQLIGTCKKEGYLPIPSDEVRKPTTPRSPNTVPRK